MSKVLSRTYAVAGTSTLGKETKVHFTSDYVYYTKRLVASGADNVQLVRLPKPMNRLEAAEYLLGRNEFSNASDAIRRVIDRHSKTSSGTVPTEMSTSTTGDISHGE